MALDYIPRGDLASFTNVKATTVTTWPISNIKVPTEKNGGGTEMARGETGGSPTSKIVKR